MKTIGGILIAGGIVLMIYALMFMDTSVAVNYPGGNSFGMPDRVVNLGLMADRQNYLIASSVSIIIGLVLFLIPASKTENTQTKDNEDKQCPQCAEKIKKEAKICRFCNYKFTEAELMPPPEKKPVVLENEEKNFYFIHLNSQTGSKKKYIYLDQFSAERSLIELEKGNECSRIGLLKILDA